MRSNRLWKAVLALSLVTAAAATLVSVAGASGLQSSASSVLPESNIIDPLSRRGEEAPANRSESEQHGKSKKHNGVATPAVAPTPFDAVSNAVPGQSFEGLSMWDQRTLNGFYLEPPDQGMCASTNASVGAGGRVVEAVNDVFAAYNTAGTTLKEQTLNQFFGYPGVLAGGPELTDPSCYYDEETGAWFVVVLTLELDPNTGNFTGENHLDINVSNPANHDPSTTTWKRYTIDTTDNGNHGSPNHGCGLDPNPKPGESMPDACIGDYPHIGADRYGFYITTNEYPFFTDGFNSAQIYALSKHKLAANDPSVPWVQFSNTKLATEKRGPTGFTIWPAVVPGQAYDNDNGGTEFFLSSDAAEEAGNTTGSSDTIGLWAITNSSSLDTAHPDLNLSSRALSSEAYGVPPLSDQPSSGTQDPSKNWPLGQCLNIDACFQAFLSAPGEKTVRDVMTRKGGSVPEFVHTHPTETLRDAIDILREYGVSQMPVVRAEPPVMTAEIVGAVHERDLLDALFNGRARLADPLERHMSDALPLVGAGEPVAAAVAALHSADAAVVLDDGRPVGIVTRQDLLGFLASH